MVAITDKNRRIVKRLYYKDLYGARQIADKLGVSLDAVYYFMRRHKMKRRSFAEENKIRFDRKEPSFHIRKNLSPNEKQLKTIGTILYWGEGYKTEKSKGIDFTNSDPQMIDIFICFLRNICGVDESRLRVLLYCYSDQDPKRLIKFWSKICQVSPRQFSRPYVRTDYQESKKADNQAPESLFTEKIGNAAGPMLIFCSSHSTGETVKSIKPTGLERVILFSIM